MAYNDIFKNGQVFEWSLNKLHDSTYNSSVFDMFGSKSKWMLTVTPSYKYQEYFLNIKLIKCQGEIPYYYCRVITFVTIDYQSENSIRKEVNISSDKAVYDIFFAKRSTYCQSVQIIGILLKSSDFYEDISTQVSVECFESQIKRKCIESSSSLKISESSLTSPVHLEILSEDFSDMLQKSILTDIKLKNGEVSIPSHKAVLASRSKVFFSMFEHEMVESITGSIDIDDIETPVLQEFLKYLYSGKISGGLPAEVLLGLYKASDKYAVQSLQEGCRDIFVRNLTKENCIEILILGENHSDQQLKDAVAQFITERYDILLSDAWLEFTGNFPKLANVIYKLYVEKTSIIKQDSCK